MHEWKHTSSDLCYVFVKCRIVFLCVFFSFALCSFLFCLYLILCVLLLTYTFVLVHRKKRTPTTKKNRSYWKWNSKKFTWKLRADRPLTHSNCTERMIVTDLYGVFFVRSFLRALNGFREIPFRTHEKRRQPTKQTFNNTANELAAVIRFFFLLLCTHTQCYWTL